MEQSDRNVVGGVDAADVPESGGRAARLAVVVIRRRGAVVRYVIRDVEADRSAPVGGKARGLAALRGTHPPGLQPRTTEAALRSLPARISAFRSRGAAGMRGTCVAVGRGAARLSSAG